jgi:threonine dehydratase
VPVLVGPLAYAHLRRFVDRIVTVTEAQIAQAMRVLASDATGDAAGAVA